MFPPELNGQGDNKPALEKKVSREDKKILDAIRLMQKDEANQQRADQKSKIHQKEPPIISKPRKQPKIEPSKTSEIYSPQRMIQIPSNSPSEAVKSVDEEKPREPEHVINPSYRLTTSDDLFMHLISYRQAQKEKLLQKSIKSLVGLPYPESKDDILLSTEEVMRSTTKVFSKIQAKFEEGRAKLKKPNAKEHKEFQTKFLNEDFLRNS